MKKNRSMLVLLLFTISFLTLHDFTIDILKNGQDSVTHYVNGADYASVTVADNDIDDMHYIFHIPMLLEVYKPIASQISSSKIQIIANSYSYTYKDTFLKPPIL